MKIKKHIKTLLIVLISITSITACTTNAQDEVDNTLPIKTTSVKTEEISVDIHTSGILASSSEEKLSFKIPGIIKHIYYDEGASVKKGDLLASLDLVEINNQVNQAKQGFEKAKRDLERVQNLYNEKVVTFEQLQNTETALSIAESKLKIAEFNQNHSKIYAPSNGRILKRTSEKNELVNAGYPIFLFGSKGKGFKMKLGVVDKDIIKIKLGEKALISFDVYPNQIFTGRITEVGESANSRNGTFEVEVQLDKNDLKLSSGFVGKVEIKTSGKTKYSLIPVESLVEADGNEAFVYSYSEKDNTVEKIEIGVSGFYENMVLVNHGLGNVTKVVTEGSGYLTEKSKIKIVN